MTKRRRTRRMTVHPLRTFSFGHLLIAFAIASGAAADGEKTPSPRGDTAPDKPALIQLSQEAAALRPLVRNDVARRFLDAVRDLPAIDEKRTVYWDSERQRALTPEQAQSLTPDELEDYRKAELGDRFYYYTTYGTPLAYARAIDLAADAGWDSADGQRVLDFGFGGIGHLRLLASLGADAVGLEVVDLLRAYYREPSDTGAIPRAKSAGPGPSGRLTLLYGRFPAEREIVDAVGEGYGLVLSKNTLKKGYIHPERPTEPRFLVHLGVEDPEFVQAIHRILKPGGLFVIYNLYPPQNPPDKPYIPYATGRCPFERSLLEKTGFEILVLDHDDTSFAREMAKALNWENELDLDELFAMYTIVRKPKAGDSRIREQN